MDTRTVGLLGMLTAVTLVYGWFIFWPGRGDLRMVVVHRPSEPPTFALNRETVVREVQMVTDEPVSIDDPAGDSYERTIWHLVPTSGDEAADPAPRKHITYGRPIGGLTPAEGSDVRGEPLKSGRTYRFTVWTSDGAVEATFVAR